MTIKKQKQKEQSIGELTKIVLAPVLHKRLSFNLNLFQNWHNIVGKDIAKFTKPIKLTWPINKENKGKKGSARLVIACESTGAIIVMHQNMHIIARVNDFFGYRAINKICIEQVPSGYFNNDIEKTIIKKRMICISDEDYINNLVRDVENNALKKALVDLGKTIYADK